MEKKYVVIIPARLSSTRLPGKPLIDLNGLPMIVRTFKQVTAAVSSEFVYVATDSLKIKEVCESHGIKVLMTSANCLTGTDRVAECLEVFSDVELFVNVQGDEPVFNPEDLITIIRESQANPEQIINGYSVIESNDGYFSTSTPKVVFRLDGRLLYMSRAPIPSNKKGEFVKSFRQVCCYSFPRKALEAFSSYSKKTPLESSEDIEILRFLELGFEVKMIELSKDSIAVDNPDDVEKVKSAIEDRGL